MSWRYQLTDQQWQMARAEALEGLAMVKGRGLHGFADQPEEDKWRHHTLGVAGEMAFSAMTGLPRLHTLDDAEGIGAPDFAPDLEIRTRSVRTYDLLIWPDNDPARRYVLMVTTEPRAFEAKGWLQGHVAAQQRFLRQVTGRPAAYFVPQQELWSMASLVLPGQPMPLPW